jgi:hypothetical protein
MKLLALDQISSPDEGTKTIIVRDGTYVEQLRAIAGGAAASQWVGEGNQGGKPAPTVGPSGSVPTRT